MRILLLSALFAFSFSGLVRAQGSEIQGVIGNQIEAFKADDFAQAFSYASPNIQGIFKSPENFGNMVRNGYPMVWRPNGLEYLDLREVAGLLVQRVRIRDARGVEHLLDYQMVKLGGDWKINGVFAVKAPDVGA